MIFPPVARAAVVVKPRVTETPALAAVRSVADMLKETAVTLLKIAVMAGALTPADKPASALDDSLKPPVTAA